MTGTMFDENCLQQNVMTPVLLVAPSVTVWQINEQIYFDKKFYDGFAKYIEMWPGGVVLAIRVSFNNPSKFGLVPYESKNFNAKLIRLEANEKINEKHLQDINVVLASADNQQNHHISQLCKTLNISCVYTIEYIFETRLQIARIESKNFWQKFKTSVWLYQNELKLRRALRNSDGIQANGVPAYSAYAQPCKTNLLYFDTRIEPSMGITDAELESRLSQLDNNNPLRLGFSGRLIKIKGADHLVCLAKRLKNKQIPFSLDIFGDGDLMQKMQQEIKENALTHWVHLHGPVDFKQELIPFIKENIDIFVMCHRQSDPSCTYLETYSCGVPIIGYNNKAHSGILHAHDVGWETKMNGIDELAGLITKLHVDREEIKRKSRLAIQFARNHFFEQTFKNRIDHLIKVTSGNVFKQ